MEWNSGKVPWEAMISTTVPLLVEWTVEMDESKSGCNVSETRCPTSPQDLLRTEFVSGYLYAILGLHGGPWLSVL